MIAPLRLFIWEGNGISDAYHDDGTLVVLAGSPEEARQVVRTTVSDRQEHEEDWSTERDALAEALGFLRPDGRLDQAFWQSDEGRELNGRSYKYPSDVFDGSLEALDREPDRVVELDGPKWVAFNGGGYD